MNGSRQPIRIAFTQPRPAVKNRGFNRLQPELRCVSLAGGEFPASMTPDLRELDSERITVNVVV